MAWHINIVAAQNKQTLKDAVAADPHVTNGDVPEGVLATVNAAIDALPDLEDSTISVFTNGHFFTDEAGRGTSNFMVNVQNHFKV
jgi:hypothetical protein